MKLTQSQRSYMVEQIERIKLLESRGVDAAYMRSSLKYWFETIKEHNNGRSAT